MLKNGGVSLSSNSLELFGDTYFPQDSGVCPSGQHKRMFDTVAFEFYVEKESIL